MAQQHVVHVQVVNMKQPQLHVDYVMQTAFHVYQHLPPIAFLVAYCRVPKVISSIVTINVILIVLEQPIN